MAKLAVIFGLLALASFSSADIMFVCAPNTLSCPNQTATYANCNFTSTIAWEVTFGGDTIGSVEMNITDPPGSGDSVTVNGIDIQFVHIGVVGTSAVSSAFVLSPNASLNGVLLSCTDTENTTDLMTEVCPSPIANIFDSSDLPAPQNLTLDYDSIMDNSIEYSWDPPATSHVCRDAGDMYCVRISINGDTNFFMGDLTMAKLIEQGAGVNQEHCISVTTLGTDQKPGMYTPEVCITIDRPAPVDIAEPVYTLPPMGRMTSVRMNWSYEPDSRPMIWRYYVTHNFTRPTPEESSGSGSGDMDEPTGNTNPFVTIVVNPDTTSLMFPGVLEGWWYSFSVTAENVLGNTTSSTVFVVQRPPMTTPTATPTMAATTAPTASATPTEDGTDATTLPVWAIAVIAVGGAIVLAMIVAFVVIIFCCCFCGVTAGKAKQREEHEMHGTKL